MESIRRDREHLRLLREKQRQERPRPFLNFVSGIFSPIVSWWGFMGTIPALVWGLFWLGVGLLVVSVLRLLFKRN
jgi:hypothetical protein